MAINRVELKKRIHVMTQKFWDKGFGIVIVEPRG